MPRKIVIAKIIMQFFEGRTDWDEYLEPMTFNKWLEFIDDYSYVDSVKYLKQFVMLLGYHMLPFCIAES